MIYFQKNIIRGAITSWNQRVFNYPVKKDLCPFRTGMKPILVVIESAQYEQIVGAGKEAHDSIWFTEAAYQFFNHMKSKTKSNTGHKLDDIFLVGVFDLT